MKKYNIIVNMAKMTEIKPYPTYTVVHKTKQKYWSFTGIVYAFPCRQKMHSGRDMTAQMVVCYNGTIFE